MVQKSHEAGLAYVRANLSPEVLNLRTKKKALVAIAAAWKQALDEHKEEIQRIIREWEKKYKVSLPKEIADYEELAIRAGFSVDYIQKGKWSPDDIMPKVQGYLLRLQDEIKPKKYLNNWREILVTLGMKNNSEDREKVRNFNSRYDGPILFPGQGAQPKVEKTRIIEWWDHLETEWADMAQQVQGKKANAESQHNYGRDGTPTPEISGEVKRRRKDRKK